MVVSPIAKRVLVAAGALMVLGVLRFAPWRTPVSLTGTGGRETLTVGFLPVT